MIKLVNLTPHEITVVSCGAGGDITIPPSGIVARAVVECELFMHLNGIPVVVRESSGVEGLPEPVSGTVFIVSSMALSATSRTDVVAPDTGDTAVRDGGGKIVAVTRFVGNP